MIVGISLANMPILTTFIMIPNRSTNCTNCFWLSSNKNHCLKHQINNLKLTCHDKIIRNTSFADLRELHTLF